MKWPPLLLFLGWLAIFPSVMRAKEPGGPQPPTSTKPPLPDCLPRPSLLRQNQAANFYLILGRLQLDPVRYRKGSQTLVHVAASTDASLVNSASPDSKVNSDEPTTESLHIDCKQGMPSLHYTLSRPAASVPAASGSAASGPAVRLTIDADGRGPWRIESQRVSSGGNVRVVVSQAPNAPIVMQCFSEAPELTIRAATWLHLREADRAIFVEHLEPILDELLWPYRFSELANAAQAHSIHDQEALLHDDPLISQWIDDLRSSSRNKRTEAERKLRAVGVSLLPRLTKLDWSSLDAEQQHRLREIRSTLTPLAEDDAVRLANLIRDDADYWRLAASRLDSREQQVIAKRFHRLGSSLPGDPAGQSPRIASGSVSRGR